MTGSDLPENRDKTVILPLYAEKLIITKRRLPDLVVRVEAKTHTRDVLVDEPLSQELVVIDRVPVGCYVDTVPDSRQEGDVTILPVVEEEIVVTRRLFLREEVHIRRTKIRTNHIETVTLREQQIVVTRKQVEPTVAKRLAATAADIAPNPMTRSTPMEYETIVAVYDTPAHAELAANDLRQAGIPDSDITLHSGSASTATNIAPPREEGFWASLFGGETEHDSTVYDHSLAAGSTVLTVKTMDSHAATAIDILESHHPIDIDERAAGYGLAAGAKVSTATPSLMASDSTVTSGPTLPTAHAGSPAPATMPVGDESGSVQLSEEFLTVGKRLINHGGTRIRRYVVEKPVEENVTLHSESVTLERRPVTDGRPVSDASFSEKVIEMTETAEEAVVSKTARVVEEVALRKQTTDRVETIHDTVRKEEVEVEQIPGKSTPSTPLI